MRAYRTIGPLVTIYGHGGHLGHVTQIQTFIPRTKGGSKYNLVLIGQAVLEKKMFEHCE